MARLEIASDRALLVVFDDAITPAAGRDVRVLTAWLREDPPAGLVDLHPAYASVLVQYDPLTSDPDALSGELARRVGALAGRPEPAPRRFTIPVRYGGEDGPDLPAVARRAELTEAEAAAAHAGADYEVRFIGFSPGFPYLAGLPDRLRMPRKDRPATRVPAGSVAIAGAQAGIYPLASPGGWNVIGRTSFVLFDPSRGEGPTLAAGDRVRFVAVERLP
jgi:KipI family sensor histidine kinase inhibitor